MQYFLSNKENRGFTLIELLVVIAVISMLSSVIMASLNGARIKARDTRRVQDIRQLQIAITLYFDEFRRYPDTLANLVPNQISSVPTPPAGVTQVAYRYARYGAAGAGTYYHLGAELERPVEATLPDRDCRSGSGGSVAGVPTCNGTTGNNPFNGTSLACTNVEGTGTDYCYDVTP